MCTGKKMKKKGEKMKKGNGIMRTRKRKRRN